MGNTPGPILSVGASVDDLRNLRDQLRQLLAQYRTDVAQNNADIAADQTRFLQANTAAEKEALRISVSQFRQANADKRADMAALQQQIVELGQRIPSIPLKVDLQGVSTEALQSLRDEFGALLGPLNGVTGRISSIIGLISKLSSELVGVQGGSDAAAAGAGAFGLSLSAAGTIAAAFITTIGGLTLAFKELVTESDKLANIQNTFEQLTRGAGASPAQFITQLRTATQGLVSDTNLMTSANRVLLQGLPITTTQISNLIGSVTKLALVQGKDATESFDLVTRALSSGRLSMLAYNVGLDEITKSQLRLAQEVPESIRPLVEFNVVMDGIGREIAKIGDPIDNIGTELSRAGVAFSNFFKDLSISVSQSEGAKDLAESLHNLIESFSKDQAIYQLLVTVFSDLAKALAAAATAAAQLNSFFGSGNIEDLGFKISPTGPAGGLRKAWDDVTNLKSVKAAGGLSGVVADLGFGTVPAPPTPTAPGVPQGFSSPFSSSSLQQFKASQSVIGGLLPDPVEAQKVAEQMSKLKQEQAKRDFDDTKAALDREMELYKQRYNAGLVNLTDYQAKQIEIKKKTEAAEEVRIRAQGEAEKSPLEQHRAAIPGLSTLTAEQRARAYELDDAKIMEIDQKTNDQIKAAQDKLTQDLLVDQGKVTEEAIKELAKQGEAFDKAADAWTRSAEKQKSAAAQVVDYTEKLKELRKEQADLVDQLAKAKAAPQIGPQQLPLGMIEPGNINLNNRPKIPVPGTDETATVRSMSFEQEGQEILVPTAADNKILTDPEAMARYEATGENLGKFASAAFADAYAEKLHEDYAAGKFDVPQEAKAVTVNSTALPSQVLQAQQDATKAVTDENDRYAASTTELQAKIESLRNSLNSTTITESQRATIEKQMVDAQQQLKDGETEHVQTLDKLLTAALATTDAFKQSIDALRAIIPATKDNVDVFTKLNAIDTELEKTTTDLTEAQKKNAEETTKTADAHKKLQEESQKLTDDSTKLATEISKQQKEYDQLASQIGVSTNSRKAAAEQIQQEKDKLAEATAELKKQQDAITQLSAVLAARKQVLADATQDTDAYVSAQKDVNDTQTKLDTAEKARLEAAKQVIQTQDELRKSVITLGSAWKELTQIVVDFGVALPKPLVQMVAMIETMQKLLQFIDQINSRRGINIPVNSQAGNGAPGSTTPSIGGVPGIPLPGSLGGTLGQPSAPGGGGSSGISDLLTGISPIVGFGGAGAALGGSVGGTLGAVGGGIAGAGAGTVAALAAGAVPIGAAGIAAVAGPIGFAIGAIIAVIGIFEQKAKQKTAEIAQQISDSFKQIMDSFTAGNTTLIQTLNQTQQQRQAAIDQLSGRKGGQDQLNTLLPQFDQQIAQLQGQQKQIFDSFNSALAVLTLPSGIQDVGNQLTDLNKTITQFVQAGGSAASAAQYLDLSLTNMKNTIASSLLTGEQQAINLLIQEIDLQKQKAQLIASTEQQINGVLNQGVASRSQSIAQSQAQQIATIKENAATQLQSLDDQINQTKAQVTGQQELYGLSSDELTLKQQLLQIETLITQQQNLQVEAQQQALAALTQLSTTGTPQNNNLLALLSGASQPDFTSFLNLILQNKTVAGFGPNAPLIGQEALQNVFGTTNVNASQLTTESASQLVGALENMQLSGAQGAGRDTLVGQLVQILQNPIATNPGSITVDTLGPLLTSTLSDSLSNVANQIAAAVTKSGSAVGPPSIGGVTVNISGTADMNAADLAAAVQEGIDAAYADMQRQLASSPQVGSS